MDLKSYVRSLASRGKSYFTESDALNAIGTSKIALRAALRRLKQKREIACPLSGFFIIVPPEYQSLQSLPPEQFIDDLMRYLKTPYYVALLSAAQFYGAAHQKPQTFQVIIPRARRNIEVGRVKISFITKHDADQSAIRQFKTSRGFVQVADPATIAIDLVTFPQKSGGISTIFEILSDLSEHLSVEDCIKAIPHLKKAPALQRLGYFLELLGLTEHAQLCEKELKIHSYVKKVLLDPHEKSEGAILNIRWNLIINIQVSRAQFEQNLIEKASSPHFVDDIRSLLSPEVEPQWSLEEGLTMVRNRLFPSLPGEGWRGDVSHNVVSLFQDSPHREIDLKIERKKDSSRKSYLKQ